MLLLPPSKQAQARRLRERGDSESAVSRRIAKGEDEERRGRALSDHVVVNDDLDQAVSELAAILAGHRNPLR